MQTPCSFAKIAKSSGFFRMECCRNSSIDADVAVCCQIAVANPPTNLANVQSTLLQLLPCRPTRRMLRRATHLLWSSPSKLLGMREARHC